MQRLATACIALILVTTACADGGGSAPSTSPSAASPTTAAAAPTTTAPTTTAPTTTTTTPTTTTTTAPTTTTTTIVPPSTLPLADIDLALDEVATGFDQPVFVDAPAGDDRLFIVDQPGSIDVWRDGRRLGVFLDIRDLVAFGGERGLLGLAFHPDYPEDPRFYVHYSDRSDGATVVAEYRVSADPNTADPGSARVLLRVPQPAGNHNGGMIAFGPDRHLYVALGDGGGGGDRFGNAQNPDTPLGAILRIDVDGDPYGIPAGNPFPDGGAPEIWVWGLRNPWRFSFDGDLLFIGDVGQNAWEEIDVVDGRIGGINFGWPVLEGTHCYASADCEESGFEPPVYEYPHEAGNCSVTGGFVYRGSAMPQLAGAYFFGDYCSGLVASFRIGAEGVSESRAWPELTSPGLTSFGTDGAGELYVTVASGSVYRIVAG